MQSKHKTDSAILVSKRSCFSVLTKAYTITVIVLSYSEIIEVWTKGKSKHNTDIETSVCIINSG